MKKTDWIFIASLAVYSYLFWEQEPGLNFLIMNVVLLGGSLLKDGGLLKNRNWLLAATGALVSAGCVAWHGNVLSVFANFCSLLAASAFVVNRRNSLIVAGFMAFCSVAASFAYMISDAIERSRNKLGRSGGGKGGKRTLIVVAAIVVVLVFFFMYRESSVLFYNLTEKINLDFISFEWCAFMIAGTLVFYGYYHHRQLPGLSDASHALQLAPSEKQSALDKLMSAESEHFSGMVLLALLNVLLLVVNGLDASFIFAGTKALPDGVTYTEYVHQGVGMLIFSIVCAMLIILYYFRGRMNFFAKSRGLRALAMVWIVQNAFMLVTTMSRNHGYVQEYGLTYKRIGVDVYLLLALIGLATTAWKVYYRKTNAFLVRTNSWLFYGVLVAAGAVNWDKLIFDFNVSKAKRQDVAYMNTLSYAILPHLVDYERVHPFKPDQSDILRNRIFLFMQHEQELHESNSWPSMVLNRNSVFYRLQQQPFDGGKRISMSRRDLDSIYYFPAFAKIESLDVSGNHLASLGEIPKYKELKWLDLGRNKEIVLLNGIETLTKLEELDIRGLHIRDFSPLLRLTNLRKLHVSGMSSDWEERLKAANPQLEINAYLF